jgi:hypothetical protein
MAYRKRTCRSKRTRRGGRKSCGCRRTRRGGMVGMVGYMSGSHRAHPSNSPSP